MSDTPRTDSCAAYGTDYLQQTVVPATFARQLERELNDCRQILHTYAEQEDQMAKIQRDLAAAQADAASWREQAAMAERTALEQADKAAAAQGEVERLKAQIGTPPEGSHPGTQGGPMKQRPHVFPIGHPEPLHHVNLGCWCQPLSIKEVGAEIVVHHAFDEREKWERQGIIDQDKPWCIAYEDCDAARKEEDESHV